MHKASEYGQLEVAKILIDKKANVNAKTIEDITTLHLAVQEAQLEIVKFLVQNGSNINAKTSYANGGFTPLCVASSRYYDEKIQLEIIKYLLSKGADKNIKTSKGFLPYSLSNSDKVKSLLSIP